jgi:hypothetical protein
VRPVLGFLALHVVLIGVGLALLRAVGLVDRAAGWRAVAAAVGPALLVAAGLVVPFLITLLVIGIPLTLVTATAVCIACAGVAEVVARRRTAPPAPGCNAGNATPRASQARLWFRRAGIAFAGAYVVVGAVVLARLPTVLDDARIWSLKGLTLTYYHRLQPEIFQNPGQAGGHPVYPLLQPVLEALLSQAMGRPQLRLFHSELWLLFAAAIWTAAYLILRAGHRSSSPVSVWLAALAALAVTPAAVHNIVLGDADVTASVLLATGTLALGLWAERRDTRCLALSAVLLTAAASTKDEDLAAAVLVLLVGGVAILAGRGDELRNGGVRRLWLWSAAVAYFALLVLPWRIWVAAHHLSDAVQPPLPRALTPGYIVHRAHEFHQTVTAMATQTLSHWGWLAAIFFAVCVVCLATRTARRVTCLYVVAFWAIVFSLLWLYTTTPARLSFLIPTSMSRTVGVFMLLAALATGHLLAALVSARSPKPASARSRPSETDMTLARGPRRNTVVGRGRSVERQGARPCPYASPPGPRRPSSSVPSRCSPHSAEPGTPRPA